MANPSEISVIKKTTLKKIADAIRTKTGLPGTMNVADFASVIRSIDGGGVSGGFDAVSLQLLLGGQLETDPVITDMIIPEGIVRIGTYAFYQTKMKSITFPSTLTYFKGSDSMYRCNDLEEITFLGDWNSNITLPNNTTIKTVYCHSWFYNNFKASPTTAYISSKLKSLHDVDLTDLIVEGLDVTFIRDISTQLTIKFNEIDSAFDEQREYHWEIDGVNGVSITDADVLVISEDAEIDKEFTIRCVSDYDPNIFFETKKKVMDITIIYDRGIESDTYRLTQQNSGSVTITRGTDNIVTKTSSSGYGDVCTLAPIDLTNANTIRFYGKISSTNGELGHVFVTTNPTLKHTSANCVKRTQLNTTVKYYDIDITDLVGEYYVGFGGSNRTVTCYELYVL